MSTIETPRALENNDGASERAPRRRRMELTAERQALAAAHVPLARSLARSLKKAWPQKTEEFDSAALMALVEAAESFDAGRGVKFATFARLRILGALQDVQRAHANEFHRKGLPNVPRAFRYIPGTEERDVLLMTSPEPHVADVVASVDEVEHLIGLLPKRLADACREIYLNGRTQSQVAAALGLAKSRISCLHAEAMDLLRQSPRVRESAAGLGIEFSRN